MVEPEQLTVFARERLQSSCRENTHIQGRKVLHFSTSVLCKWADQSSDDRDRLVQVAGYHDCQEIMDKVQNGMMGAREGIVNVEITDAMARCVVDHRGCSLTFYHPGLEDDDQFEGDISSGPTNQVYLVNQSLEDASSGALYWSVVHGCRPIPAALVLGGSVGGFLALVAIFFLSFCLLSDPPKTC